MIFKPMKLKYTILIFLISQLFQLNGQVDEIIQQARTNSLQVVLSQLTGTEKIDTLNKIAFSVAKDYPDSCRKLATSTVRMSDSMIYQKGLADGYQNLGESYYVTDSLYPAMINYLNALRIYEQIDPSFELAKTYQRLSILHNYSGRHNPAIEYRLKAIELINKLNKKRPIFLELYTDLNI